MNRSEIRKQNKMNKENKRKTTTKKFIKYIKLTFVMLFLIAVGVIGYYGFKFYPQYEAMSAEADEIIEQINERTFVRLDPTSIVRKDGTVVREFTKAPYKYIESHEMPPEVKESFVAIEDKSFYKHEGFDIRANLRAVKALIDNKGEITQGGSTITQQLVKNTFLTHEQTYERKIKEILISVRLENRLSKDKILEYYINNIYYGNGAHGIETAADYYFSDSVSNLSLSEIALLAAIPNNPTVYNPITNLENAMARRDRILTHMFEEQFITESEMNIAKEKQIELNLKEKDKYVPEDYEVTYIMSSATKIIMEHEGFDTRFAFDSNQQRKEYNKEFEERFNETYDRLRAGGYTLVSTIDPVKQEQLQDSINQGLSQFTSVEDDGLYRTQGAGVTIDNRTNELVAIVGGRTQESVANTFNRAFLSYRQPGSVIKPVIVYGVEVENGMLGSTNVNDVKAEDGPRNAGGTYRGNMTAREALQRSVNTVPFEMLRRRGVQSAREIMTRMEFSNIVDGDDNAGLAIGGFTHGTTPLEINGAFSTFANNGNYVRPTGIDSIQFDGDVIYENVKQERRILNDGTAYLLTDMMKGVLDERHGTGYGLALNNNMPAAAKSGTTDGNRDGWFAGYTPYYTSTIWVGNDNPSKIDNLYGGTYPGRIWKDYMDKVHSGLEPIDFEVPAGTKKMYVNPITGEVSDVKREGFIHYEYVPEAYITAQRAEQERLAEIERQKEEERKQAEQARKEEFLREYGVTEEEELRNRANLESKIAQALAVQINSDNDYEVARQLLIEAERMLDNIKVEAERNNYEWQIERGHLAIQQGKVEAENRRKAAEEELRRFQEQQERQREEQERLEQEEEERRLEEERERELREQREQEEREQREREEQERLEQEEEVEEPTEPTQPTEPEEPAQEDDETDENGDEDADGNQE